MRRCRVKADEKTGRFLKNGQSRKKGLNRSISDAGWAELILKIEYLAAKQGKVVIKINPKYSSQECRNCGHIDKSNRDGEKFICALMRISRTRRYRCSKNYSWSGFEIGTRGLSRYRAFAPKRPEDILTLIWANVRSLGTLEIGKLR